MGVHASALEAEQGQVQAEGARRDVADVDPVQVVLVVVQGAAQHVGVDATQNPGRVQRQALVAALVQGHLLDFLLLKHQSARLEQQQQRQHRAIVLTC
jgi:hypothetical protein